MRSIGSVLFVFAIALNARFCDFWRTKSYKLDTDNVAGTVYCGVSLYRCTL